MNPSSPTVCVQSDWHLPGGAIQGCLGVMAGGTQPRHFDIFYQARDFSTLCHSPAERRPSCQERQLHSYSWLVLGELLIFLLWGLRLSQCNF